VSATKVWAVEQRYIDFDIWVLDSLWVSEALADNRVLTMQFRMSGTTGPDDWRVKLWDVLRVEK
jgi:hypothetical protein